jgi:hypothetical protein
MAARNSKTETTVDETTATDAPVDETTETPAETTEAPAAEPAAPIDLTAFQAAVDEAVSTADESTGTVPEAGLAATLAAYRDLPDTRSKNAARNSCEEQMKAAVVAGNIIGARAFVDIKDNLSSASGTKSSAPKDPTEAFVSKVSVLAAAFNVASGTVPEGVSEDWVSKYEAKSAELTEQVKSFIALPEDATDEQVAEFSAEVRKVAKMIAGGGGGGRTYNGPRRSVLTHLEQVFANEPVGSFITVTELSKRDSEEYGDEHPTTGAISARLFPPSGNPTLPEGIEAVIPEDGTARGARKVA